MIIVQSVGETEEPNTVIEGIGKMNYNERKKEALDLVFGGVEKLYSETQYISINDVEGILEQMKGRPLTLGHIQNKQYESYFNTPKEYDRFMKALLDLDINFKYDLINTNKFKIFNNIVGIDQSIVLFNKLRERKISLHNFLSNVPNTIKYPALWKKFLGRLITYTIEESVMYHILSVSNYKRILNAPNKEKLLNEFAFIETHKKLYNDDDYVSESYMLLNDFNCGEFLSFTKNSNIITSVGGETLCCFRKGGVGESVMLISLKSPIAGIIHGSKSDRTRWFAYVWEMVEYNKTTKLFEINLILDNIEANRTLDADDFKIIQTSLKEYNKYAKVYLGYLRNDIDIPQSIINTKKKKPFTIPYFGREVHKYAAYDDSREIYTLSKNDYAEKEATRKAINIGDYHRLKYIIDYEDSIDGIVLSDTIKGLFVDKENKLYSKNKNFKLEKIIDLEKSYVEMNDYAISAFEIYDIEGELYASYHKPQA